MSTPAAGQPVRSLYPHVVLRRLPADAPAKIACLTVDFECDYGARTGQFRLARHEDELQALRSFLRRERIPLSLFVVTEMLDKWSAAAPLARLLGDDWHSHSHTHRPACPDLKAEIAASREGFRRHFGRGPAGYRAPMGLLRPEHVPLLAEAGFSFSASIFPSLRPGTYNHLGQSLLPLRYENGLIELPFGVVRGLRVPVAISYFKLLGPGPGRWLLKLLGVPRVLVVNFHLHDVVVDEESLAQLTGGVRAVYGIRKHGGRAVLEALVRHLRAEGYTFLTMTELYDLCANATGDAGA
ncbi:MAG: polysaccharide deacetylase family protein [Deltaproteobacteria bacterium]|nr:polysaccharide deacetylase family protein [Deltaproteobacteria bacterium]